jgi:hypothetical protein
MLQATTVLNTQGLILAEWQSLAIIVWKQQPQPPLIQALGEHYQSMSRRYSNGFYVMVIVEDGVPLPDAKQRDSIADAEKRGSAKIKAIVGVQEASGFLGAAIRSVLLGMSLATRSPYRRHICANVMEAATWLNKLESNFDKSYLVDIIHELRH